MSGMDAYDGKFAPQPFGLNNTGVICHFNSLLQGLAGCPAMIKAVLSNPDYMSLTKTGRAFYDYISAIATLDGAKPSLDPSIYGHSAKVLSALVADLRVRRPAVRFGASQESASEGLVLLLDMIEPPVKHPKSELSAEGKTEGKTEDKKEGKTEAKKEGKTEEDKKGGKTEIKSDPREHPITRLFLHRYNCEIYCSGCKSVVSSVTDLSVQMVPVHIDSLKKPARTVKDFSEALRRYVEPTSDYFCLTCKKKQTTLRLYRLSMIPEIVVLLFKVYYNPRPKRYIPDALEFPGLEGGRLNFRQVAQIQHFGTLGGGHYVAQGLRGSDQVYAFNDSSTPYPTSFVPYGGNENTYIAIYHYSGQTSKSELDAKAALGAKAPKPEVSGLATVTTAMASLTISEPKAEGGERPAKKPTGGPPPGAELDKPSAGKSAEGAQSMPAKDAPVSTSGTETPAKRA